VRYSYCSRDPKTVTVFYSTSKEKFVRRRILVSAGAVTAAALVLTGCSSGGSDDDELTFVMWGGQSQKQYIESIVDPWASQEDVKIKQDQPTDYAKLDAMVDAGKVSWGVVEVEPNYSATACSDGKVEKLDDSVFEAAKDADVNEEQLSDCAIPILQYTFNIGYNTDTFGDKHPETWEEFFDTDAFPGKRGMWKYVTGGIFEAALIADGVEPDDLYPLDLDRAFDKLDTIKDDIVWYDTGDEQVQLLSSGEAPLVQAWNGRVNLGANDGQPIANEYNENLGTYEHLVIPKGYENPGLAQKWMKWFLAHPEAQADASSATGYGPASPKALDHIEGKSADELAGSEAISDASATIMDYDYWAENYADVTERFNKWISE
jgi:putative spermidine/putrescine transport system substrate-binding protein